MKPMKSMKMLTVPFLTLTAAGMLFTGCYGTTTSKSTQDMQARSIAPYAVAPGPGVQQRTVNVKQATDRLEAVAKKIPEVKKATAILVGKTAIVGIDVDKKLKSAKVDNIKYAVARALHKEPYGMNAVVTSDTDIGQRIMNVRNGIINGRPFSAFTNELGEIIGRIAPQMAAPMTPVKPVTPMTPGNPTKPMIGPKTLPYQP